jgi:predicted nuclease of restriction endonuclease-like (RecB) superfamily
MSNIINSKDYDTFLNDVKKDIQNSRSQAALAVNQELTLLYGRIGKRILEKQQQWDWGAEEMAQLSFDLAHDFPGMRGVSKQNLSYMRQFAGEYGADELLQQAAEEIPWEHNIEIFTRISDNVTRLWYIEKTIENAWSRRSLIKRIESFLHLQLGGSEHVATPSSGSTLTQQIIKSEYTFDFLGLANDAHRKVIERRIAEHVRDFLLSFGAGLAFLGSQYHLTIRGGSEADDGKEHDYDINSDANCDLLFYHTKLRSYMVVKIHADIYRPEHASNLESCMTLVDQQLKQGTDTSTIGLLLCKKAGKVIVEYALNCQQQPTEGAKYTTALTAEHIKLLPTQEQLQHLLHAIADAIN